MEILIILAVLVIACWFLFFRESSSVSVAAPYKVETPPTPEPVSVVTKTAIHEYPDSAAITPVLTVVETAPVVEAAPAKKPRKPRAPKVVAETPAAKKAAPVKKAAAIKASPKKPTTPRSKKV
jgi:hypothetical protein